MPGEPDPLYVRARAALLDTAEALGAHLDAMVLVGAQAIYLHTGAADRVRDKDALDMLRLLQAIDSSDIARRLNLLVNNDLSAEVTSEAIAELDPLFGETTAVGVQMAIRAAGPQADSAFVAASMTMLINNLRTVL